MADCDCLELLFVEMAPVKFGVGSLLITYGS